MNMLGLGIHVGVWLGSFGIQSFPSCFLSFLLMLCTSSFLASVVGSLKSRI
ncbi:hypothetical protein HanRHA438_Chr14g0634791 [Helianthus annuus]|nr:hypothetical protein HanRHA438_Chr14g0634791 [Helianthus annuus]